MPENQEDLQRVHYERRFAQVDKEVGAVKRDVGVLQADVRTLATGQVQMQHSMDRGFTEIKEIMANKSAEPPKLSLPMMIGVVGLVLTCGGLLITALVAGVGAFWTTVVLYAGPIKEDLQEYKAQQTIRRQEMTQTVQTLHSNHGEQLVRLRGEVDALHQRQEDAAELRGKMMAYHEWVRDDLEACKKDLERHDTDARHPTDIVAGLRAASDAHAAAIERMDRDGTRNMHSRLNELRKGEDK